MATIYGDEEAGFGLVIDYYHDSAGELKGYSATFPHQCDRWSIAGDEYDPVELALVKARLMVFAADVQAALAAVNAYVPGEV